MANFDSCAPCPMEMELENLHVVRAVSPTAAAEEIPGGHRVTVTDYKGQTVFNVMDGAPGISPTVTTEAIPGGHRVTVEDGEGAHSFDVLDGPAQFAETDSAGQDSGFTIGY